MMGDPMLITVLTIIVLALAGAVVWWTEWVERH
jgi:hypothetical protein